jgi:hypothetical protein
MPKAPSPARPTSRNAVSSAVDFCYYPTDRSLSNSSADTQGNRGYKWDEFDPTWYVHKHYAEMHDEDFRIIQMVRDHFGDHFERSGATGRPILRGIDVGSGPNLYPALTMLPVCQEITLWERGLRNVRWLRDEVPKYSSLWDKYWNMLAKHDAYDRVDNPQAALRAAARVRMNDLFLLPKKRWDIGTMFFVAESVSDREREFKVAIRRFVEALKPGAVFAAALMRYSTGYDVGNLSFPAVAVNEVDVEHALAPFAHGLDIQVIRSGRKVRDGYRGMILAFGKAGRAPA